MNSTSKQRPLRARLAPGVLLVALLCVVAGCITVAPPEDEDDIDFEAMLQPQASDGSDAAAEATPTQTTHTHREHHEYQPAIPEGDGQYPPPDDTESAGDSPAPRSEEVSLSAEELTDGDLEAFVGAYVDVIELQHEYQRHYTDASSPGEARRLESELDERSQQLLDERDLSPQRFNAIVELLGEDDELRHRAQSILDSLDN